MATAPRLKHVDSDDDFDFDHDYEYDEKSLQGYTQREALIARITNEWQKKNEYKASQSASQRYYTHDEDNDCDCDIDPDDPCLVATHAFIRTKAFRRTVSAFVVLFLVAYMIWRWFFQPAWQDNKMFLPGLNKMRGAYGVQTSHQFRDITQVHDLEEERIPGGKDDRHGKRRLIFVGDIHGCSDELSKLLNKVDFDEKRDHLIATGDMVSKGPDSAAVIDKLMSINASAVRGNHEDRLLTFAKSYHHLQSTSSDVVPSRSRNHKLLESLSRAHIRWLKSLPLILRIQPLSPPGLLIAPDTDVNTTLKEKLGPPILNEINVVHAGLVPAVPLRRQDPYSVMNMRAIHPPTHMPSAVREEGVAWERVWNWYQDRVLHGKELGEISYLPDEWPTPQDTKHQSRDGAVEKGATKLTKRRKESPKQQRLDDRKFAEMGDEVVNSERELSWWRRQMERWFFGKRKRHQQGSPKVVVYGHDSKRGLNLRRWSKGLDSSCVKGGQLTALVVDAWGQQNVVSVDCKSYL